MNEREFDQFAEEYQQTLSASIAISGESPDFFSRYKVRDVERKARKLQIIPQKIVDFGCGVGSSIRFFREFFPQAQLIGTDISRKSIEIATAKYPHATDFIQFNGITLDHALVGADLIFSACVFHHIPDSEHERLFAELRRIAHPGALLAVFEHNPFNPVTVKTVNSCPFDRNAKLVSASALSRRVQNAGWSDVCHEYRLFVPRQLSLLRPMEQYLAWCPLGAQYVVYARAR